METDKLLEIMRAVEIDPPSYWPTCFECSSVAVDPVDGFMDDASGEFFCNDCVGELGLERSDRG